VDRVINSHYHEDHTSCNFLFPDAALYVHKAEALCYQSMQHFLDCYGLLGTEYEQVWRNIFINDFHYREREPAVGFQDGDRILFGKTTLEVIHTPGHSSGHCSFYFPEEGLVFLGDLDMTRFGPWYGDRVSDIDETIESIRRLQRLPARVFVSAHEAGIIEGDLNSAAEAYLAVIEERERNLVRYLAEPRTLDEIVCQWMIYKKPREPRHFFDFCERALTKKHLERLERKKRLKKDGDKYVLI